MNYSIKYYKEKDTDPMVFLQRFRCTTEPIGGGTEYDKEGELVSWDAAVAAIEIAMKRLGWHPATELPAIPNGEDEIEVYCLVCGKGLTILVPMKLHYTISRGFGVSENIEIKWWCYPPKED